MSDETIVWVVGTYDEGEDWSIAGIFSTEEKAIDACEDGSYFIGPCVIDGGPDDSTDWDGVYYPLAH